MLSGVLAIVELLFARRKPPAFRACSWIFALFALDAGAAMIMFALLSELFKGLTWFNGAWQVLLSGLCGSALLRSQLSLLGSGLEDSCYGPATRYRRIQQGIEKRIDQIGADAQSDRVAKAVECVLRIEISELHVRITSYIKALDFIDDAAKDELISYFDETLTDYRLSKEDKYRAVVQKLMDCDCRQCVSGLVRRAKKLGRSPHQSQRALSSGS